MSGQVALILLGLAAVYFGACRIYPYVACRTCDGGKRRSGSGKTWSRCRRCEGSGQVERWGARVWRRK